MIVRTARCTLVVVHDRSGAEHRTVNGCICVARQLALVLQYVTWLGRQ